ncbi:MAG TPA: FecR domain-containing protein [Acidimicrobiales bacterium]|nr:FecR domain-containing protein [Acidimicrobiales bacterium]
MKKVWLGAAAAAVVAVVAVLVILPGESSATGAVKLKVIKETVSMKAAGASGFTRATTGQVVAPRAAFKTDATGVGQFNFWDGSLTRIGPSTEYSLNVLSRNGGQRSVEGKLDIGKTWHNVKKVTTSGSRFEVRSSNAVAAVRGTKFAVVCLVRNVCTIAVAEGSVLVTGKNGDVVLVGSGQEVTVDELGQLSPLRPISDDPWIETNVELDQVEAEVTPGDEVTTSTTSEEGSGSGSGSASGSGSGSGSGSADGGDPAPGQAGAPPSSTPGNGPPTTTTDTPRGGPPDTTPGNGPPSSTPPTTRDGYPPRPPGP